MSTPAAPVWRVYRIEQLPELGERFLNLLAEHRDRQVIAELAAGLGGDYVVVARFSPEESALLRRFHHD